MVSDASGGDEPGAPLSSRLPTIAGWALAAALAFLALRPVDTPDLWWHLSMGRATWEAGSLTYPDPVALGGEIGESGREYVNVVWLFDVPLYLLHRAGGLVAVNLLVAALGAACFAVAWLLSRDIAGPAAPWTALLVAALAGGGAHLRFIQRPQAVFLVLLPFTLWLARRAAHSTGLAQAAYSAGLLSTVATWAQVHASVVIAPAVALAATLPWSLGPGAGAGPTPPRLRPSHFVTLLAVALLPACGPSGLKLVWQVLAHREGFAVRHIAEMQPMKLVWWLAPTRDILFAEILVILAVAGIVRSRRLAVGPGLLALLGLALTLNTNRFAAAWNLLLLPLVVTVWRPAAGDGWGRATAALAATVAVPGVLALGSQAPSFEAGSAVPQGAGRAIEALDVRGPIFNDHDAGGYLGWKLYGRHRVLIDSRSQMRFEIEEIYAATRASHDPQVFSRLHGVHGFSAALVDRDSPLCPALAADRGWAPVWLAERHAIFLQAALRKPGAGAPLRGLEPCRDATALYRCRQGEPEVFLDEVEALLRLSPAEPYLGRLGALLALRCAVPPAVDRAAVFLDAAASEPSAPDFLWLSALQLAVQADAERALALLAVLPPEHVQGQILRLRILRRLERPAEALPLAHRLEERLGTAASPEIGELLAWACEETEDFDCAVRQALRAALAGGSAARERLARFQSLGKVPAALGTLVEAALARPDPADPRP